MNAGKGRREFEESKKRNPKRKKGVKTARTNQVFFRRNPFNLIRTRILQLPMLFTNSAMKIVNKVAATRVIVDPALGRAV
jgi:hypothetical protein